MFGASIALFGCIALLWHDADTWQTLSALWRLPSGTLAANVLMIAFIAAGIGIQFARTERAAAVLLAIVCAVFSLACVPGILKAPRVYQEYGSFFEQFVLLCGACAVYAAAARGARSSALVVAVRLGVGVSALSFMLEQAFYLNATASLVPAWIPPGPMFWALLTTVAFGLAALAILIGRFAGLATSLTAMMVGIFGALVWIPAVARHSHSHGDWSECALTFMIAGACWVAAGAYKKRPAYAGRFSRR